MFGLFSGARAPQVRLGAMRENEKLSRDWLLSHNCHPYTCFVIMKKTVKGRGLRKKPSKLPFI